MSASEADDYSSDSRSLSPPLSTPVPPAAPAPAFRYDPGGPSSRRSISMNPGSVGSREDPTSNRVARAPSVNSYSSSSHYAGHEGQLTASDRKRRFTGSEDFVRRPHIPGEFRSSHRVNPSLDEMPLPLLPASPARNDAVRSRPAEVVDLTASSPPPSPPRHARPSRNSSSSSRRYVVPPWQPDSEVSECPICKRPFTWMFRRHHCRKCGRVVCADCSPHRITIPRQFIVQPPGPEVSSSPSRPTERRHVDTVDLTRDDEEEEADSSRWARRRLSSAITPLEGGEKVRLCNPCVPDPQPLLLSEGISHEASLPPLAPALRHNQARGPRDIHHPSGAPGNHHTAGTPLFTSSASLPARDDFLRAFRANSQRSSITNVPSYPHGYGPRTRPTMTGNESMMGARLNNHPLPPLPGNPRPPHPAYGHHRFSSLDPRSRPRPENPGRPRVTSMIEGGQRHSNLYSSSPATPYQLLRETRPRLRESDICPICRRALPPRGADGGETEREAHIMACISSRDPSTNATGEGSSSSGGRLVMRSFTASEKDCIGADGNPQECSICMVEYDVGDQLARLECFCKFHKECIVSWLSRKAECPVHKASSFNL